MRLGTRLILGIIGIIIIAAGIFSVIIYLNIMSVAGTFLEGYAGLDETALAALILLVVGLIITSISVKGSKGKGDQKMKSIVNYSQIGEIRISFQTIENMALRVSREIHGIKETTAKVSTTEQGLVIALRLKVIPDLQIPNLSAELQNKIKEYIEDKTGSPVNEVKVFVENIVVDTVTPRQRS